MSPTTVYRARRILTMNPSRPEATHVAVRDGRILGETPAWIEGSDAQAAYGELAGKTAHSAKEAIVALLREGKR